MCKKKVDFESICAVSPGNRSHIFYLDSNHSDYDCVDTCVIWDSIIFYGIPFDLSGEQINCIYEEDYSSATKIGEMLGCLILCKQILNEGDDPLDICDAVDGDLEYTISALSDKDGPLHIENGDSYQDVFYIHELNMEASYDDAVLKSRIINELPRLILSLFHVAPDLLAYYPMPLEFTPDLDQKARYEALQNIAMQKMERAFDASNKGLNRKEDGKILRFGDAYQFSADELNLVMRRRHSGSSYPEDAKNKKEYAFYTENGFEEVGDSRLLYKLVEL
jgi:hypothetical protein